MLFRQLFDRESSTYTYLIADNNEALLIDPVIGNIDQYLQLMDELNLKLILAVDTHTHADHITALGRLRETTGCLTMLGEQSQSDCVSVLLGDGQQLALGSLSLKAIYTPGHTDDSYSFLVNVDGGSYVFTGDTLLIRGTGRTDFQNGNAGQQYHSIFDRLLTLPGDTLVYPGHDYKGWTVSTIAEEKRYNPRLQVKNKTEYIELMNNVKLADPKLMDIAVPANRACGVLK